MIVLTGVEEKGLAMSGANFVSHRNLHDLLRDAVRNWAAREWSQQDIARIIGVTPSKFSQFLQPEGSLGPGPTRKLRKWLEENGYLDLASASAITDIEAGTDPLIATAKQLEATAAALRATTNLSMTERAQILAEGLDSIQKRFLPWVVRYVAQESEKPPAIPE